MASQLNRSQERARRDRRVWDMYVYTSQTQAEIGKALGISGQRVGQIIARYRAGQQQCPACQQPLPAADRLRQALLIEACA